MAIRIKERPSKINEQLIQQPWWNKPLWGKKSMLQRIESIYQKVEAALNKPSVPEDTIFLHNRYLEQLERIATRAEAVDSEKFTSQEFLHLVRVNLDLKKDSGEYQGLSHNLQLLQMAVEAKSSFLSIESTELSYRSVKQQEFYQYIFDLLSQNLNKEEFQNKVQEKFEEILPHLKSQQGRTALESYKKALENLSRKEIGLKLLYLFKQYDLADFAIIKKISDLIESFGGQDLLNIKEFIIQVQAKYELFERLGQIIGIPATQSEPSTYANMLQYLALTEKHQLSYIKFQQLVNILLEWRKPCELVVSIREQYSDREYKQPKDFNQELPGTKLYLKYKNYIE